MATTDQTGTQSSGNPANDGMDYYTLENTFDFAESSKVANSVLEMISIPAGTFVSKVLVDVITADTGNTFDVGSTDIDGWHDGVDATAAVKTMSTLLLTEAAPNTVTGYTAGKLYTTADTIDLKVLGQTFAAAKIRLVAYCERT